MGEAADTLAKVVREQWEDYLTRFKPVETALMNETSYMNPSVYQNALAEAGQAATTAYQTGLKTQQNLLAGYGVLPDADTEAVNQRVASLGRTAALADAANRIRMRVQERDTAIATGAAPTKYGLLPDTSQAGG